MKLFILLLLTLTFSAQARIYNYPFKRGFSIRNFRNLTVPKPLAPVGKITIRGIRYNDHTANTTKSTSLAQAPTTVTITSRSLNFSQINGVTPQIRVFLQDANRPSNSFGVTGFGLTGLTANQGTLTIQIPNYHFLKNRTFHVAVFVYAGAPFHYANAGTLTIK